MFPEERKPQKNILSLWFQLGGSDNYKSQSIFTQFKKSFLSLNSTQFKNSFLSLNEQIPSCFKKGITENKQ